MQGYVRTRDVLFLMPPMEVRCGRRMLPGYLNALHATTSSDHCLDMKSPEFHAALS